MLDKKRQETKVVISSRTKLVLEHVIFAPSDSGVKCLGMATLVGNQEIEGSIPDACWSN